MQTNVWRGISRRFRQVASAVTAASVMKRKKLTSSFCGKQKRAIACTIRNAHAESSRTLNLAIRFSIVGLSLSGDELMSTAKCFPSHMALGLHLRKSSIMVRAETRIGNEFKVDPLNFIE